MKLVGVTSIAIVLSWGHLTAHERTPTYPKFEQAYVEGIYTTNMEIFNRRFDIDYYEIEVFNKDWEPVRFAAQSKIMTIGYLSTKKFQVYVAANDLKDVEYICTKSKLYKGISTSVISSKICSKIKRE